MKNKIIFAAFLVGLLIPFNGLAQSSAGGWFSLGFRNTLSAFDHDGTGLGTGGQFRIRLSDKVNTDWFADYISIKREDGVRSLYYHTGWSVLFYPMEKRHFPKFFQPYLLAGHCFDYNQKTVITDPSVSKDRWGSAVQAGLGTYFNLSERFDISFTGQYMIHLTKELEVEHHEGTPLHIHEAAHSALEGHLLLTLSLNYKVFRLWKK